MILVWDFAANAANNLANTTSAPLTDRSDSRRSSLSRERTTPWSQRISLCLFRTNLNKSFSISQLLLEATSVVSVASLGLLVNHFRWHQSDPPMIPTPTKMKTPAMFDNQVLLVLSLSSRWTSYRHLHHLPKDPFVGLTLH